MRNREQIIIWLLIFAMAVTLVGCATGGGDETDPQTVPTTVATEAPAPTTTAGTEETAEPTQPSAATTPPTDPTVPSTEPEPTKPASTAPKPSEPEPTETQAAAYTIRYEANGGYFYSTYASPSVYSTTTCTVEPGETHTVISAPKNNITYTFAGWKAPDGTIYQPGDKIVVTGDMTMKAMWKSSNS